MDFVSFDTGKLRRAPPALVKNNLNKFSAVCSHKWMEINLLVRLVLMSRASVLPPLCTPLPNFTPFFYFE